MLLLLLSSRACARACAQGQKRAAAAAALCRWRLRSTILFPQPTRSHPHAPPPPTKNPPNTQTGTGKTLLAKAVAGEAGTPFFSCAASEFVELFVGVGASRVRDLFEKAKAKAPCIIFIDEIDAVGRQRGAGMGGGNDEREQTINQLLTEMDGFEGNTGVIVLAATNRPDVLDQALLRPGRFDRQVTVDRPDVQGRVSILKVCVRACVRVCLLAVFAVCVCVGGLLGCCCCVLLFCFCCFSLSLSCRVVAHLSRLLNTPPNNNSPQTPPQKVHARGKVLSKDVDLEKVSRRTPGFTGADLQNLMNEAAILAARRNLKEISKEEIADALERIIAGPEKKNAVMTDKKRSLVAYHEVCVCARRERMCVCVFGGSARVCACVLSRRAPLF